jgi:predicted transposase YbfD/YdcC
LANEEAMTKIATEKAQDSTFFRILQNNPGLDLRDERGKLLNLPLFLLEISIAFLRNKDGNLSRIHRSISNKHKELLAVLNIENEQVVSRSHLPILLKKVNGALFSELILAHFGVALSETEQEWFGIDGKELRGSILKGDKRGEAIVPIVRHKDRGVLAQGYYNGSKDSERPTIADLLTTTKVASQNVSMDALHFVPATLEKVASAGGHYLVGLKENQPEMFDEMTRNVLNRLKPDFQLISEEKGHGREEKRHYKCWNIEEQYVDKRWKGANLCTLVAVNRGRLENKSGKFSQETSLYMSNKKVTTKEIAEDLFAASRGHWSSEVYNNIRDTTLAEDKLKTIIKEVSINLSIFRTLTVSILHEIKPKNMAALLDNFSDDFQLLINTLKSVNVL